MMTKKYKILGKFIKDLSSETPDIDTYLFVKERIAKYQLGIDITSKALKNKMIEVNTKFKFEDKEENKKKSYFEINYTTIIKINDDINDQKRTETPGMAIKNGSSLLVIGRTITKSNNPISSIEKIIQNIENEI